MSICIAISDMDWSLTRDAFGVFGTLVTFVGVMIAGYVGFSGLKTWKQQARGSSDHDLALRMLTALYKFEMDFNGSRAPGVFLRELRREPASLMAGREGYYQRLELGFERRIERISDSFAALSAIGFGAKALWGDEAYQFLQELQFLKEEFEEYVELRLLCVNPFEPEDEKLDHRDAMLMRRNVFREVVKTDDEFGAELELVVKKFSRFLSSKIISS